MLGWSAGDLSAAFSTLPASLFNQILCRSSTRPGYPYYSPRRVPGCTGLDSGSGAHYTSRYNAARYNGGRRMENPFAYGIIATGQYFTDRERELAELKLDIRSGQNVVIISPRRYGKTSLVYRAMEELRREGLLIAYLDLVLSETKAEFASNLANALYDGLVAPFDRALKKAGDFFSRLSLRPKFTIDDSGKPTVEIATGVAAQDVDRLLADLLALPGRIAKDRKKRVALIMDEFQEVVEVDAHLPAVMRSIFQQQGEVSHVFLGSKRHLMRKVFTDDNQPMYRMAKLMPLGVIDGALFANFLRDRFATSQLEVSAEAIDHLLEITGSHPYDTQQLAYFTWSKAYLEGKAVTSDLVDEALLQVLQVENGRFSEVWQTLPTSQRLVLKALASTGDGGVFSESYRLQHGLGAPTTVQKALSALREKGLVESTEAGYTIPDRLFRTWITRYRHRPDPRVTIRT